MAHLPPVDEYRQPFIEPLGHLLLHAAALDNALVELCSMLAEPGTDEPMLPTVAGRLRNWTEDTRLFVEQTFATITDDHWRGEALRMLARFVALREERHRAVHDAVDVGIFGDAVDGYEVRPLRVGFPRVGRDTIFHVVQVTPESIATLAVAIYELKEDVESAIYALRHQTS